MFTVFTDGSCDYNKKGSDNNGSFAFVIINENGVKIFEKVETSKNTTNNRMELSAVICALKHLKDQTEEITICTDSEYVSNPINKGWLEKWKKINFKKKHSEILNSDLWKELDSLLKPNVKIKWIKGHSKENVWNEYVDKMCSNAYSKNYTIKKS